MRRIAKLARIAVPDEKLAPMADALNGIFNWVEMLNEVDVEGVPAMTSVVDQKLKWRPDASDRRRQCGRALMKNAPEHEGTFFVVPKVVE